MSKLVTQSFRAVGQKPVEYMADILKKPEIRDKRMAVSPFGLQCLL